MGARLAVAALKGWRRRMPPLFAPSRRRARPAGAGRRWLVGGGLCTALLLLVAGVTVPTMTIETLPLFEEDVSVLSGLAVLWDDGQYALFAVLLVFSLLFPAGKLLLALWVWFVARWRPVPPVRLMLVLDRLAKWSMLDVFVIAVVVAAVNVAIIGDVFVQPGLYCFTGSVLLSKILVGRITAVVQLAAPSETGDRWGTAPPG